VGDDDQPPDTGSGDRLPSAHAEEYFAANMRTVREAQGMSQVKFAEEMVTRGWAAWRQQTVTRVETGGRTVRLGEATAVAEILETSVDLLLRPPYETAAIAVVENTAKEYNDAWGNIVQATSDLHRARVAAEKLLAAHKETENERILTSCASLAGSLADFTAETAINFGKQLFREDQARWDGLGEDDLDDEEDEDDRDDQEIL
jgi:transcriptional regulator with XRE-family HTH domain